MSERDQQQQAEGGAQAFRLMRYYTIATLAAFIAVALVLVVLQRGEEVFFEQTQHEQATFFSQAQATLARQHEAAARSSLLAVHEASHVNLTRLVANMLWASDFGPFVARAQRVSIEPCRAIPAAAASAPNPRKSCLAEAGEQIRALPGFQDLDGKARSAMRSSTVFKIKVFDLRGVTVYSSEQAQVGEDGAGNQGWQAAAAGRPASELTHRDRFSAFERVVENRDLISTYVPVREGDAGPVLGVVELYSDVTPFLEQIKVATSRFAAITAANEAAVADKSKADRSKVHASSDQFLLIVLGLLALLYAAGLLIVRNGQRLIDRQARAQEEAARREQLWHREKMGALATLAANVSHEVGNPLAIIAGVAQELPAAPPGPDGGPPPARRILEQTARVGAMMRQISDFASARSERPEWVDVNTMLKSVCDFHAFDRRLRGLPIELRPGDGLPACLLVPDHLNEVMMTLLQAMAESRPADAPRAWLPIGTQADGDGVAIVIGLCNVTLPESRLAAVRRRVADMGGSLSIDAERLRIRLPKGNDGA